MRAEMTPVDVNRFSMGNGSSADFNLDGYPDITFSTNISSTSNTAPTPVGVFTYDPISHNFTPFYLEIDGVKDQWPEVLFGMYTLSHDINADGIPDIIPIDASEVRQPGGIFVGNYAYAYVSEGVGKYSKVQIGTNKFCSHGWAIIESDDGKFRIVFNTPWSATYDNQTSIAISTYDAASKSFSTQSVGFYDQFFGFPGRGQFFYLTGVDVNNDGNTDIVGFADIGAGKNAIYLNDGKGGFNFSTEFSTGLAPSIVVEEATVGDFNGDGFKDLAVLAVNRIPGTSTPDYTTLKILINVNGTGFSDQSEQWIGSAFDNADKSYSFLDTFDVNEDGLSDFSRCSFDSVRSTSNVTFTLFVSDGNSFQQYALQNAIGNRIIPLTNDSLYDGQNIVNFSVDERINDGQIHINKAPGGSLVLKGTFAQRGTIMAKNAITDGDGIPAGAGVFSYTWYADDVQIAGANASRLVLTQEQVGKTISVKASWTDLNGNSESVLSAASAPITDVDDPPTGTVSVIGSWRQGELLKASDNLDDLDGLGTMSYQWYAGGRPIAGAISDTFIPSQAQVGKSLTVTVSYIDGFNHRASATSAATAVIANVNDTPTGNVSIAGKAVENQTLNAITSSLKDADGLGKLRYQWECSSDGNSWIAIKGGTNRSLNLGDNEVQKHLRVVVSYIDKMGTTERLCSELTDMVENVNDKPFGAPIIRGNLVEAGLLTADSSKISDTDGLGNINYVWKVSEDKKTWREVATEATYRLGNDSVKQFVQLTVKYTDGAGTLETVSSKISASVAAKSMVLQGTDGADALTGASANDSLNGGGGCDTLTGGGGKDIFIFRSVEDSPVRFFDSITDFSTGDKINLWSIDANIALPNDQAFKFSTTAAQNSVWWDSDMLYADVDGDAQQDFGVQVSLVGLTELTATDLLL